MEEIKNKNLALSFVLQGFSYSLPLENLFEPGAKDGEMDSFALIEKGSFHFCILLCSGMCDKALCKQVRFLLQEVV